MKTKEDSVENEVGWRNKRCPQCDRRNHFKDFIKGYPGGEIDQSAHSYGGCLPEYWPEGEIVCLTCGWEGLKSELKEFIQPSITLTGRFIEALFYANQNHRDQTRKATNIAYISHPLAVAGLIIEAGGDEDQAIAGLLHDVPEDCGGEARLIEIMEMFGPRVEAMVRGCSDALPAEGKEKDPYVIRKSQHIHHLNAEANADVLLVTAADKLHNARAIVTDLEISGKKLWSRFNGSPQQIIWYYKEMFKLLKKNNVSPVLLKPLKKCIDRMQEYL